ncbi:MAG TPA: GAF domain-containing protein [Longimicrobium sp.]|nr:GAF domain-containing protein [Longimicrobium sp.]
MPETFGFRLRRFALAVDIVDDEIFRQVWALIRDYITPHLRPSYWALLTESEVNQQAGLAALDCSLATRPAFSLNRAEGGYNGLAAYSFVEGRPLWVVGADQQPLGPRVPLRDEWSGCTDLPGFDRSEHEGIRTVILVPIRWKGRRLGLMDLQSREHHELTGRVIAELENLAETLAVLLPLCEGNRERRQHTLDAIELHYKALREEQWPPLTKPQIFVASSDRADPAVMAVIDDVLHQFRDHLRVHYWKECSETGNINAAMLREIQGSQYGLCYFSEPADADGDGPGYRDNHNVVFEAGMLQALTAAETGWIPVREADSPPAPFDFAQERMIVVRRRDRAPRTDALRAELTARLERMLE